ncbi:MAG: OB-fold nucleic acid binding domain-containing protein [Actinobacteria bacterium]|nr:OB-fold nucleic acid binding domain-containing protein [Actinomycetota bacterium]
MLRRFLARLFESDEARLADEVRDWARKIPGCVLIADAQLRDRVKLAGVVNRITVLPMEGNESLEALVSDGTGEVTVVFMGRRSIPGLTLGTRVVVEGMLGEQRGNRRIVNPRFEFSR